jgi:hypothetical protein
MVLAHTVNCSVHLVPIHSATRLSSGSRAKQDADSFWRNSNRRRIAIQRWLMLPNRFSNIFYCKVREKFSFKIKSVQFLHLFTATTFRATCVHLCYVWIRDWNENQIFNIHKRQKWEKYRFFVIFVTFFRESVSTIPNIFDAHKHLALFGMHTVAHSIIRLTIFCSVDWLYIE